MSDQPDQMAQRKRPVMLTAMPTKIEAGATVKVSGKTATPAMMGV